MPRKKKEKPSIDATLKKAKSMGMTYAECQIMETMKMIQDERKKAKNNG